MFVAIQLLVALTWKVLVCGCSVHFDRSFGMRNGSVDHG